MRYEPAKLEGLEHYVPELHRKIKTLEEIITVKNQTIKKLHLGQYCCLRNCGVGFIKCRSHTFEYNRVYTSTSVSEREVLVKKMSIEEFNEFNQSKDSNKKIQEVPKDLNKEIQEDSEIQEEIKEDSEDSNKNIQEVTMADLSKMTIKELKAFCKNDKARYKKHSTKKTKEDLLAFIKERI